MINDNTQLGLGRQLTKIRQLVVNPVFIYFKRIADLGGAVKRNGGPVASYRLTKSFGLEPLNKCKMQKLHIYPVFW